METFLLQFHQRVGSDGLHLRHDKVRLFLLDHATQFGTVQHVDDVGTVGHLHAWGVSVAVHGDHFDAETHHLDDDFLAQLARTAKKNLGGARTKRCTDFSHKNSLVCKKYRNYNIKGGSLPLYKGSNTVSRNIIEVKKH